MYYGVSFDDYHTLDDWGLYLAEPVTVSPPEAQTHYIEVPGRDGPIDLSEANGRLAYNNREMEFDFVCQKRRTEWPKVHHDVLNTLHGKSMKIILDEDSDYYYEGRVYVEKWGTDAEKKMEFPVITADVGPFKWEHEAVTYSETFSSSDIATSKLVQITAGTDVSKQDWNVDYRYSVTDDLAFDFSLHKSIYITYTVYSKAAYHNIQFVDRNGGVYDAGMDTSAGAATFTIDALEAAGIDTTCIYRILISGASAAEVYVYTSNAVTMTVEGATRTTTPVIIVTSGITAVTLNGITYDLSTGANLCEDIILDNGDNELIFYGTFTSATITVSYQRGFL